MVAESEKMTKIMGFYEKMTNDRIINIMGFCEIYVTHRASVRKGRRSPDMKIWDSLGDWNTLKMVMKCQKIAKIIGFYEKITNIGFYEKVTKLWNFIRK